MRGTFVMRGALPALLTVLALSLPMRAMAGPNVGRLDERVNANLLPVDDAIGAPDQVSGAAQVLGVSRTSQVQIEGPLPTVDLRAGPFVAYNNTAFCDPNNVTITDFNATVSGGLLAFLNGLCGNSNQRFGCDLNDCTPSGLSGPLYYQDSGTSVPTLVNGFSFLYASDHGSGPGFVPMDFDMDGDVDTADFGVFGSCFGGAFNPPAAACPAGIDADFDNDGDVDTTDFGLFGQCFGGAFNLPAASCPFGQGGGGGNQIDMNLCFSVGTDSNAPNTVGSVIVDDFSGTGGSTASRAIYTCVDLPGDATPGDGFVAFIQVDVDLMANPPTWMATRFIDSAVFTGTVQKDGVVPAAANRLFNLPGGNFGINMGCDDNTIEALVTIQAHGGAGNQNGMRVMDQSPACDTGTNPCGTALTPDLTVILVDPSNGNCTFDNCTNCAVENSGLWFVMQTMEIAGEPNETIDADLPTVVTNDGCFTTTLEIGGGQGPTDVDMQKVSITSGPRRLVAYAEGVGTPPNRGNPLLRVFDSAGNELASNDSDGRTENSDLTCPPHAGVNALVGVDLTAAGDYYVAVSGGGCDAFLLSTHPTNPCEPDPSATCNDNYDPLTGAVGSDGVEGVYTLTLGISSMTPSGTEPNDDVSSATPIASLNFDSGATLTLGDGPFGSCLGDFDYFHVPDSITTDGNFLDVITESNSVGNNTDAFVIVYEVDTVAAGATPTIVAVNDNEATSFDARALVPINAGSDYYVMVMGVGIAGGVNPDVRGTCFRQFGGFTEFEPGFDSLASGGGDSIPGANGAALSGVYRLLINERTEGLGFNQVPPANTGAMEPNDSIAQAAANSVLTIVQNQTEPASATVFMGDGRYSWTIQSVPPITVGDVDIFKIEGLDVNDVLEAVASPQGVSMANLFNWIAQSDQIIATPTSRLTFTNGGVSSQTLSTIVDPNDTYVVVTPFDGRPDFLFNGNLLPWDLTIPGTLLNGNFTGQYNIAVKSRSVPPAVAAGSRMWGVFRGTTAASILEINPDTGTVNNSFAVPPGASVNGASTGLAYAKTPPGRTTDVLYYMNPQGGVLNFALRMWELDPNTGAIAPGAPALGFTNMNLDTFISGTAGIAGADLSSATDGLGFAGQKLWLCNQNEDKIVRWNTVTRRGDAFIEFTGSPFFRECRDGLEGTDDSNLGSGSVIYVAARENNVIVLVDVGTSGNGPANNGVFVSLGEMDDPTFQGGAGNANTGGLAILPQDPGNLRGSTIFNLYCGNINTNLTDVVESEDLNPNGGTVIGGWVQPDFGASGYTGTFTPPAEALGSVSRLVRPAGGAKLARQ